MIFVCLGTKRFPFNRLLQELDRLIEEEKVTETVVAQIGQSTYIPQNYEFKKFMDPDEYDKNVQEASLIITHGGTGAIVKALKAEKQVIAVPRLEKYGEHSDNHQLQIVSFFTNNGYIKRVDNINDLGLTIKEIKENPINKRFINDGKIISIIDEFIINS